jgi:hypothetical protein
MTIRFTFAPLRLCERDSEFDCGEVALCAAGVDLASALRYALVRNLQFM